ncbi:MAG: SusC/RagA family TonB-linked outer membrane protein [Tannerella sp.]|nr:SusC/RagA family TonB-linked outer membrane protein [Tannerella sp.]
MLFIGIVSLSANTSSRDQKLTIRNQKGTLSEIFKEIEKQSDYRFFYNDELVSIEKNIYSLDVKNNSIDEVLTHLLANTGLKYRKMDDNLIVISSNELLQSVSVSGTVVDAAGEPVIGVNVFVQGTTTGTITDIDGKFGLNVPDNNAVLVFSFIGYATQEIKVGSQRTLRITLLEDNLQLEEVVVVAYGTAKKKDLVGAVTTIDSKVVSQQSVSSVSKVLEGAVAGVQLSSIDGQPGADMLIRIRGVGSAQEGNANALIVIDGVPALTDNILTTINPKDIETVTVLKDAASTALYGSRGANGVVLVTTKKGVQGKTKVSYEGRFGVNQVGTNGKYDLIDQPKDLYEYAWLSIYNDVRYRSNDRFTTNVKNPNMSHEDAALFASQHLFDYNGSTTAFQRNNLGNWMLYNVPGAQFSPTGSGDNISATMSGAYLVNQDGKLNSSAQLLYHDPYYDYYFVDRSRQEHNVSVSGASDKVDYFVSGSFLDDPAYVEIAMFKRYSARGNVNVKITDWLKAGINTSYSNRTTQQPPTRYGRNPGAAGQNYFRWYTGGNTLASIWAHNADGSYKYGADGQKVFTSAQGLTPTPLGGSGSATDPAGKTSVIYGSYDLPYIFETDKDITTSNDVGVRGYVEVKFLKDFAFTASVNQDAFFSLRHRYWNNRTGGALSYQGAMGETYEHTYNLDLQQQLTWNKTIGKHRINALAGHEFQKYSLKNMSMRVNNSLIDGFDAWANFKGYNYGSTFGNGNGANLFAMESYFGRVDYVYNDKYYGEVSLRHDGSSKFKYAENRWGTFWSVGGGWRISGEEFMSGTTDVLNDLKLRADYGVTGNQNGLGYYSGYQTWNLGYTSLSYSGEGWTVPAANMTLGIGAFPNDALTWENVQSVDVGLDFRLFNRVSATLDYFNRTTTNMIWNQPIAYSLGQETLDKNTAKINNWGLEATVDVALIQNKDLFWSVNFNTTHYRSVLKSIPPGVGDPDKGNTFTQGSWNCFLRGEGKDFYNLYIYRYMGVDPNTGLALYKATVTADDLTQAAANPNDVRYKDVVGKNVGDEISTTNYELADQYEYGSVLPKLYGGFGTTLRYKGFDLSALFAYQLGGKFMSFDYGNNLYEGSTGDHKQHIGRSVSSDLWGNTWTPENTGAKFPMQMAEGDAYYSGASAGDCKFTDLVVFSASYLNVKNITFGYSIPKNILGKVGFIDSFRIFGTLDNVWTKTAKSGVDPRMSFTGGYDVGASPYPYQRSMSVGVDINF